MRAPGFDADRVLVIQGRATAVQLKGNRHHIPVRDGVIRCVVGEALNSVAGDTSLACTGAFMYRWVGTGASGVQTYLRSLARRNVCDYDRDFHNPSRPEVGAWNIKAEMVRAACLVLAETGDLPSVRLLLCGRRTWRAFCLDDIQAGQGTMQTMPPPPGGGPMVQIELHALPHPSGRNREWNDPAFVEEYLAMFRRLAFDDATP